MGGQPEVGRGEVNGVNFAAAVCLLLNLRKPPLPTWHACTGPAQLPGCFLTLPTLAAPPLQIPRAP